jgi:hypothetical protein
MNHKAKKTLPCALKHYWLIAVILSCLAQPLSGVVQQNQISQFGITWMFDKDYTVGQFANGDYWVMGPVTIIGITPVSRDDGTGRIVHGSMLNPSPRSGLTHGYDSKMCGTYDRGYYNPSFNVARPNGQQLSSSNPLTIQTGSLVSVISIPVLNPTDRTELQNAAILTVLSSPAPEGSFRPPYSGSDKTIKFNKNQLDYSLLKRLAPVANTPRLHQRAGDAQADSVERMFERPWLDHVPGPMGRSAHPLDNMISYDREITTQIGIAALMLNLDFSNQEKEKLLIRFIQVGIDNYGVVQDGGQGNWCVETGRKFPILFAGIILNNPDMKNIGARSGDYAYTYPYGPDNPPPDLVEFEEDEETYYVSQMDVEMTHSPQWRPDSRDAEKIPYEKEDIGLPEWGKVRFYDRTAINKYWATTYRQVIGHAYSGIVLAMHIMGVKDLWNHDALFDYKDRYKIVELDWTETSRFVKSMWDVYRKNYGPLWTMSPTLRITAVGGSVVKNPAKASYILGERVRLRAVPDTGYEFTGWLGSISGKANPTVVTMHSNQSITANFSLVEHPTEQSK